MPKARPEGMVSEGWLLGAATAFSVHTTLTVFPCIHQLRLSPSKLVVQEFLYSLIFTSLPSPLCTHHLLLW